MSEWKPIETAPKDDTTILVSSKWGTWVAKYVGEYGTGFRPENPWFVMMLNMRHLGNAPNYRPTHWMPLPAPPSPAKQAEEQTR